MAETDRGLAGDNKPATRLEDEATFRNIKRTKVRLKLIAYRFNQSKTPDHPAPQQHQNLPTSSPTKGTPKRPPTTFPTSAPRRGRRGRMWRRGRRG